MAQPVKPDMAYQQEADVDALPERLRSAISAAGGNAAVIASSGIKSRTLSHYLAGSAQPSARSLARLARACGVSIDWLVFGTAQGGGFSEAPDMALTTIPGTFAFIPGLEVEASAGGGSVGSEEEVGGLLAFRRDWLRRAGINPGAARVLRARGDSMEPTIYDGDILLADTSIDHVVDNGIYVVVLAGLALVKRVHPGRDGSITLISDNQLYPREVVPKADLPDLLVAGRVMWFGRRL